MTPTNRTKLNAVIGYPLEHSLSPLLHTNAYELLGIDAIMLAFPCTDLPSIVQTIRTLPIHLTAVTIPHKETIMAYLDNIDEEAKEIGSVNTIVNKDGVLRGYNTDVIGIQKAFDDTAMKDKGVLIIGAGGAAKAAAWMVKKNDGRLSYLNRTHEKALALKNVFGGEILTRDEVENKNFDIIINTTSVGMYPNTTETPLTNFSFSPHQVVFDCVYNPRETRLLREAKKAEAKTISGIDMFFEQAFAQIHLWAGEEVSGEIKEKIHSVIPSANEGSRR
ncbi:shikimate dehydrogenase [Candidatus Uhrbacteria bacterium]|nr:shikimate dehydrogenase [Candidatus Uhrbacteria bacterium]